MHIKGIRWYMLNREVVATSAATLTLGSSVDCWGGCTGWGYFLNSHLATLDLEGEWFWDEATNRVFVFTLPGHPRRRDRRVGHRGRNGTYLGRA